jgi:16S rRNA (cytosine967-C5)-methyltransferase
MVGRLDADLGADRARAALLAQNEPPRLTLRPRRGRSDAASVAAELRAAGATVAPGALVADALAVRGIGDPRAVAAVAEGRATPQDEASQAVVALVDPQPGDRVLDVAAAPGGKSTGLGERLTTGGVVAVDVHPGRLALVAAAARRLGLKTVHPVLADARTLPVAPATVDRALVDAPCSGLGVLRRRPEARWRRTEPSAELVRLQRALLTHAAACVRPGGRLVYSVCTLTRAETRAVVDAALDELAGTFAAGPPPGRPWEPWGSGALLLPQAAGTDGMFVAVLERRR